MVLLLVALLASFLVVAMVAILKFSRAEPSIITSKADKKSLNGLRYMKQRSSTVCKASLINNNNDKTISYLPSTEEEAISKTPITTNISYVPFKEASISKAVVVDCTHPDAPTFTHHKSARNPKTLVPADTSTGLVLNALASGCPFPGWLDRDAVTVNHFDGDALFSVWAFIHREKALKYEEALRIAAALHDFRELDFDGNGSTSERAHQALALCCWINTIERAQFTPPFEESDADEKFAFFLANLLDFLKNPESFKSIWQQEYDKVLEDYKLLKEQGQVKKYPEIGVAIVRCPRPVHYYALFSHTIGCDVVVSSQHKGCNKDNTSDNGGGDGNGADESGWWYEVEEKYTQFINLWSRPVTARLDMTPLASFLNEVDTQRAPGCDWASPRFIDSGPLLRLDSNGQKLLKAQRYGHPTARPMHSSGLSPEIFENIILSFFKFGLQGVEPSVGGFGWDELHQLNAKKIDWNQWKTQIRASLDL